MEFLSLDTVSSLVFSISGTCFQPAESDGSGGLSKVKNFLLPWEKILSFKTRSQLERVLHPKKKQQTGSHKSYFSL